MPKNKDYFCVIISDMSEPDQIYPRPEWIADEVSDEEMLCPDCFKAVGVESRYTLICTLGKLADGATVNTLTDTMHLKQPTITHHLKVLKSIDAVTVEEQGRERIYKLNRNAHCFEECKIPY